MALDAKILELINAAIDGEIGASERRELDVLLEQNAEARAAHDEFAKLAEALNGVDAVTPPAHLKHLILDEWKTRSTRATSRVAESPSLWSSLWAAPLLRYASVFGFGVVVALVFASSDMNSRHAFDDVSSLVGTISQTPGQQAGDSASSIMLSRSEIAGTVNSHREDSILVIDFNLVSSGPVEIVAGFTAGDIWFNGFAQLDNPGTRVAVGSGEVRLQIEGNRRCAVYLYNTSGEATTVNLKFYAAGELLHEGELAFSEGR